MHNSYRKNNNERAFFVYILASQRNGTLYTGVTNDLIRRIVEHKSERKNDSFSARYQVERLVYYESYQYILEAIQREKQIKNYYRQWKINLIEKYNPTWRDLFVELIGE